MRGTQCWASQCPINQLILLTRKQGNRCDYNFYFIDWDAVSNKLKENFKNIFLIDQSPRSHSQEVVGWGFKLWASGLGARVSAIHHTSGSLEDVWT